MPHIIRLNNISKIKKSNYKNEAVLLFTPVYYSSPGTQTRINLISESLSTAGFTPIIVIDDLEYPLKRLYSSFIGRKYLYKRRVWKFVGKVYEKRLKKLSSIASKIIFFIDTSAMFLPIARKFFDIILLSVEDLTPLYLGFSDKEFQRYMVLLKEFSELADCVITPSYTLNVFLNRQGMRCETVLIGVKSLVTMEDAIRRISEPVILHAGQLNEKLGLFLILKLSTKYKLIILNKGKHICSLRNMKLKNIVLYDSVFPEDSIIVTKSSNLGLIISRRQAFTLTRIYYHLSLLQPILYYGSGLWLYEAKLLDIPIIPLKDNAIEHILSNYTRYLTSIHKTRDRLKIPDIHKNLFWLLK